MHMKNIVKTIFQNTRRMFSSQKHIESQMYTECQKYTTLSVLSPFDYVAHVKLNRPEKKNAMNRAMWLEILECFQELGKSSDCRVIVLSGAGESCFTSGMDLNEFVSLGQTLQNHEDVARKSKIIYEFVKTYQACLTALEKCHKPVIAAVHGYCIGGGLNLICAADIRYCSQVAVFQNKEVEVGMAADVGVLQRMPRIVGNSSLVNEMAYTSRTLNAQEAKECGLVSKVFDSQEDLMTGAFEAAQIIASRSPVAVQGTKRSLIFSRDYGVDAGLEHIAMNNQAMVQSEDMAKAVTAVLTKEPPVFSKL